MAITVNLYYTGESGNARKFAEEMISSGTVQKIREEKGNLKYEYFFPMEASETVLLIDSWKNQEAIDEHHKSPMMKTIMELREKYDLHMKIERYKSDDVIPEKDKAFIRKQEYKIEIHVHSPLKKLDGKVQSKIGKILPYIIYVLVILAGCFAFYKTQLYFYLFNTGFWKNVRDTAIYFAEHYNADGGDATVVDLPKAGITGNSHFMFQETNNREIADHIEKWLKERGL